MLLLDGMLIDAEGSFMQGGIYNANDSRGGEVSDYL